MSVTSFVVGATRLFPKPDTFGAEEKGLFRLHHGESPVEQVESLLQKTEEIPCPSFVKHEPSELTMAPVSLMLSNVSKVSPWFSRIGSAASHM